MRIITTILLACFIASAQTRIATIGSNPYLSWNMYPQDISQWHGSFITFYPHYQKSPWWGDIDQPGNKPKATYTTTGTQVIETEAFFKESAKLHTSTNIFGYAYRVSDRLMANFDVDYTINALRDRSTGNFSQQDSFGVVYGHIPYDYALRHTLNNLTVRGIFGFSIADIPVGLKIDGGFESTLALKQRLSFTKDGTSYSTDRALWGWTTSPCAHIFGARGVEGDAWLQHDYAIGPLFRSDIQIGVTLAKVKLGAQIRYKAGRQNQYSWVRDTTTTTGDTIVDDNFLGTYDKSEMTKKSRDGTLQAYGNISWLKGEQFAVNTFVAATYDGTKSRNALGENLDVEEPRQVSQRGATIEIDPNINIKLGESFHYIDAGVLLQYGYSRFNNTYERWVGSGQMQTYWDSDTNGQDENAWEQYSYANLNFLNAGIDVSTMFPLVDNSYGQLGLGLILYSNARVTFKTKYYGHNTDDGSQNTFTVNNRRKNYTRELWFNSAIAFNYMRRPYYIRLEVTEPVLYSFLLQTRITDAGGKNVLSKHRKEPLWLSQQGLRVGVFFSYEMELPFLRY
jgi:hypothetical protein